MSSSSKVAATVEVLSEIELIIQVTEEVLREYLLATNPAETNQKNLEEVLIEA